MDVNNLKSKNSDKCLEKKHFIARFSEIKTNDIGMKEGKLILASFMLQSPVILFNSLSAGNILISFFFVLFFYVTGISPLFSPPCYYSLLIIITCINLNLIQ